MSQDFYPDRLRGFDPLALAMRIQAGADKLATNVQRIGSRVQAIQGKVNYATDTVTRNINTGAEVIRATSRAGIATAATGDATSGLAAASITSPNALKLAGAIGGLWLLTSLTKGRGGNSRTWK